MHRDGILWSCVRVLQLQQVEREVDKHYLNNLMNECRREKVAQRQMMQESRCARAAAHTSMSSCQQGCWPRRTARAESAAGCRWYMGNERKVRRKKAENMKMPACEELKDQGYDVGY